MKLTGNTVVITGGSSGIGFELARVLIKKQNQVIICGRSLEKLEQAKQAMPSLHIFQCDVSKAPDRVRFAEWVVKHYPQMNILINNAAMVHKTNFFSDAEIVDKAELETRTNFIAPLALTKLFLPVIEKNRNPKLIYITTGLVYAPRAIYPIYCATKSALHSFIQSARFQITDTSVEIREVLMPSVNTPWHQGNPPKIAIPVEKAVMEMCQKLENGDQEIRVGGAKLLYILSRIVPSLALKKINSL
jgi:uncharacterized oxidoreductase